MMSIKSKKVSYPIIIPDTKIATKIAPLRALVVKLLSSKTFNYFLCLFYISTASIVFPLFGAYLNVNIGSRHLLYKSITPISSKKS